MVDPAFAYAFIYTTAGIPHFHCEIIVAADAGAELYAVSSGDEPVLAVYYSGWPCGAGPVGFFDGGTFFEQGGFVECFYALAVIAVDDAGVVVIDWLYHGGGEHKAIGAKLINSLHEVCVPTGANVHIVIHIYDVVHGGEATGFVDCYADADVAGGGGVVDAFIFGPLESAVAAIVDVQDDLVLPCRVFADAIDAEFGEGEVVPGGDDDGEHGC